MMSTATRKLSRARSPVRGSEPSSNLVEFSPPRPRFRIVGVGYEPIRNGLRVQS